jgi:anti-sigma factor RsiW
MATVYDLITDQDIEAYIDGELSAVRRRAVEARLVADGRAMGKAIKALRLSADLKQLRDILLKDPVLREELAAVRRPPARKRDAVSG